MAPVAAWGVVLVCLAAVLWRIGDGFDLTDEASYLLASDPPQRGAAFNGFSGAYLRPLWLLAGWDIAVVRTAGLVGIVAAAVVLGLATARLLGHVRVVLPVVVAAATGFYASGVRTPSYNWLAYLGAVLVCAAALRLLAGDAARWGLLAGAGISVAATGKVTTGAALAAVTVAVACLARRAAALVWAAGVLGVALVLHITLVLSPAESLGLVRRSAALLAALDPGHYSFANSLVALVVGLVFVAAAATIGGGLLGLLPVAAAAPLPGAERRRAAGVRLLCVGAVILTTGWALVTGAWSGVLDRGTRPGGGAAPLLVALALAAVAGRRLVPGPHSHGLDRRRIIAVGVLLVTVAAYLYGTNVRFDAMLLTATGLLAPACLLLAALLPVTARGATSAALAACLLVGSAMTAWQAHGAPKRSSPLSTATSSVVLGPATVRVDSATAGSLVRLVAAARAAGWRDGTPLVDASYTPAVPLALHATVPPVLVPTIPGISKGSVRPVCVAVRGLGDGWRDAWLLVPATRSSRYGDDLAAVLGHASADDYVSVAKVEIPAISVSADLLRPRPEASGAARPEFIRCLAADAAR